MVVKKPVNQQVKEANDAVPVMRTLRKYVQRAAAKSKDKEVFDKMDKAIASAIGALFYFSADMEFPEQPHEKDLMAPEDKGPQPYSPGWAKWLVDGMKARIGWVDKPQPKDSRKPSKC